MQDELKAKHDARYAHLEAESQANVNELQSSLDKIQSSSQQMETSLRQDLADLHANSSKRIKEMQRATESQHVGLQIRLTLLANLL